MRVLLRKHILCIDDDQTIQTLVQASIPDCIVHAATSIRQAESELQSYEFSGVILDIQLPDGNGLLFLAKNFQTESLKSVPILVLSSYTEFANKAMAFNLGADDFIAKPFDPAELKLRLEAKIQKNEKNKGANNLRKVGDIEINFDQQKVYHCENNIDKDVNLTAIEFKLLAIFSKRLMQVYSRAQLLEAVWGDTFISERTVDSHIAHLRQKLADTQLSIETSKNFGYRAFLKK